MTTLDTKSVYFKYSDGKAWPLIIQNTNQNVSQREVSKQKDGNHSVKNNHTDNSNRLILYEYINNSTSKGGTYNPRHAWQTIDKGRQFVPRYQDINLPHKQKLGNSCYMMFMEYF